MNRRESDVEVDLLDGLDLRGVGMTSEECVSECVTLDIEGLLATSEPRILTGTPAIEPIQRTFGIAGLLGVEWR